MAEAPVLLAMRVLATVAVLAMLAVTLQNRDSPGADALAVLFGGVLLWVVSDSLLLFTTSLTWQSVLLKALFTGVTIVVAGWGLFALAFTGYAGRYTRPMSWLLVAVMGMAAAAIWTNPYHGQFWHLVFESSGPWGLEIEYGPARTVNLVYSYFVMAAGVILMLTLLYRSQSLYRGQIYAVIGAISVPTLVDIAYQLGYTEVEYTPLAFAVSAVLLWVAVYRFKFMGISPVAQDAIIENIHDGVLVVDRDGAVVEINRTAAELFGCNPETTTGSDFASLRESVPTFEPETELSASVATPEEGPGTRDGSDDSPVSHFEFEHDDRYFSVKVTELFDHHDRLVGRQFLLHEITELRRYQELLERQNEQLEEFAAVVSHDLRNPLNVAQTTLELARADDDLDHLEKTARAHDRMESLIEEMLELARQGQRVTEPESLSLETLARQAWTTVETNSATLVVEADLLLQADPDRLLQLLENCFRNAIDHAGPESTVTVGVLDGQSTAEADEERAATDTVGFYVADDGPGIPPSEREDVFRSRFTTAADGTGLGLSIVDAIASAHEWSVTVTESSAGGARFEFSGVDQGVEPAVSETGGGSASTWADRAWLSSTAGPDTEADARDE